MSRLVLAFTIFALLTTSIPSYGQTREPNRSLFFDVGLARFDIDGDFDDSLFLFSQTELYNLPLIKESTALQFALGSLLESGGVSLFYVRADPKTTSILGDQKSYLRLYGVDGYYLPFERYQRDPWVTPLLRGAFSLATLSLNNSATDGVKIADANLRGFGVTIGVGALVRLTSSLNVIAEIDRRLTVFTSVEGVGDRQKLGESLTATTNFFKVSVSLLL